MLPNWILVVILAVVFTAVLAIVQALYWAYIARIEREQEELRRRLSGGSFEAFEATLFREEAADQAARALGDFGMSLQRVLLAADSKLTVTQLIARMALVGAGAALAGGIFMGLVGLLLGIPAAAAPYLIVKQQATQRADALVSQLPDALDLMARSLQAGLGLNDAFKLVAEELPMPIAAEFGRVFEEVRFGRDYRDSFTKLLERNPDVFDLRLMVSSVLLQRETGGNLIEILENIADTIRARFMFHARVRAMTAEAKFSGIILGVLPFGVITILFLSNPAYLDPLWTDPKGNLLLVFDVFMYGTGIMIMRDLTNVQV